MLRLQRQLAGTEDALRAALEQAQRVEALVEALRSGGAQVSAPGRLGWGVRVPGCGIPLREAGWTRGACSPPSGRLWDCGLV